MDNEKVLKITKDTIEYLKQNWKDSIGKQCILWLEQTLEKLKQLERNREIIRLKSEKIELVCGQINEENDSPKVLSKKR